MHVAERTQEIAAGRQRAEKIIAASQLGSKAFSDLLYDRKSHPGPSNRCPRPNSEPLFLRAVGQRATAPHTELQHVCTRRSRARPPELRERHALSTMPCGRCYGSVGCVSRSGSNARSSAGLCARAYCTRATPAQAAMAAPLRRRARGSPRRHVGGRGNCRWPPGAAWPPRRFCDACRRGFSPPACSEAARSLPSVASCAAPPVRAVPAGSADLVAFPPQVHASRIAAAGHGRRATSRSASRLSAEGCARTAPLGISRF